VSGLSTACWDLGVASSVSLDFPEFLPDFPDFLPEIRDFRNFCWFKLATVIVLVIISISQSLLKTSKDSASRPIDFFFTRPPTPSCGLFLFSCDVLSWSEIPSAAVC
jgi:hypothetical protein